MNPSVFRGIHFYMFGEDAAEIKSVAVSAALSNMIDRMVCMNQQ